MSQPWCPSCGSQREHNVGRPAVLCKFCRASDPNDIRSAIERLEVAAEEGMKITDGYLVPATIEVYPCDLRTVLDAIKELRTKETQQ